MSRDFAALRRINSDVNLDTTYTTDPELYGAVEFWQRAAKAGNRGDCEDYMMEKRWRLYAEGFTDADMRYATCTTELGELHAVLLVDLEGQTWVLDNRAPLPVAFQDAEAAGYQFQKVQGYSGVTTWYAYRAA